ncbi:diguanylate cyclase domain-containing protein [Methylobacterium sp. NFXW15]|uniref:diguanylate cyclase domain-containing protein n=1 Tax=Methylobacterium sp. NFXW15 TaxID=2819512 RepID=UPI003CEB4469
MSGRADIPHSEAGDKAAARLAIQSAIIRAQAALLTRQDGIIRQADLPGGAGLWSCRLWDDTLDWSGNSFDVFGLPRGSRLHRPRILDLYDDASRRLLQALRARAIARGAGFAVDTEIVTPRGERRWLRSRAGIEMRDGVPVRLFGTHQDVTMDIVRLAELKRSADLDALTGLPNRRAFERRFREPEADGRVAPGALILIDLDGFKAINDEHGHAAGDACLKRAGARLAQICASADLVARLGGDEFAVLMPPPAETSALRTLGTAIVAGLACPFPHGGLLLKVGASVGIARAGKGPHHDLFARADAALYAVKKTGRNAARIDDPEGDEKLHVAAAGRSGG